MDKWDERGMNQAIEVSSYSKDPSSQVGAVIMNDLHTFIGVGYNGFPRGIADDERLNIREEKYEIVIHAEVNAILNSTQSIRGATIYTYPFPPCSRCASILIQAGIKRVVAPPCNNERFAISCERGQRLFEEAGVEYCEYL